MINSVEMFSVSDPHKSSLTNRTTDQSCSCVPSSTVSSDPRLESWTPCAICAGSFINSSEFGVLEVEPQYVNYVWRGEQRPNVVASIHEHFYVNTVTIFMVLLGGVGHLQSFSRTCVLVFMLPSVLLGRVRIFPSLLRLLLDLPPCTTAHFHRPQRTSCTLP